MKMKDREQSKNEKARTALYNHIRTKLSMMRYHIGLGFMKPEIKETEEDRIIEYVKGLRDIEHIFFDLLREQKPAKKVLEERKDLFGKWVVQSIP
jgi:hypothetical protein